MTDEKNLSTFEEGSEDFAAMFAAQEAGTVRLQPGQKVTGTIITITGDSVFVDVGIKLDGIMDRKDILDAEGNESVAPGDSIEVYVVGTSAGEIRLSRSMSGAGMAALEDARDAGVPVDGRVTGTCKGGYTVSVMGKNAFCPGSQMDSVSVADAEALVGRTMQFLIIRVENRGRNIVVSRRALLDRERQENLEKVLASLNVGDTVEGRITRLASFGAFMELAPGVEGMIHLSELSWSRVNSADEAVAVGDMVRAKLLSVSKDDKGRTRISLSRKKAEGDPWLQAADRLALVRGDMFTPPLLPQGLDVLVSNPPYIAAAEEDEVMAEVLHHEPHSALFSEQDGLRHLHAVIRSGQQALKPGGLIAMEHGYRQGEAVRRLLMEAGYGAPRTEQDLAGLDRCTWARRD